MNTFKRLFRIMLCFVIVFSLPRAVFAQTPVQVIVGGEEVVTNVRPIIIQGRVMLPARAVFEALDATVVFDSVQKKVTSKRLGTTVELTIGNNIMTVNGEAREMDVAPVIVNNRTLIPIRACSEAFGLEVQWDEKAGVAKIVKPVSVVSRDGYAGYVYDSDGRVGFEQQRKVDARFKQVLEPQDIHSEIYYKYDEFGNSIMETVVSGGGSITNRVITNTYDHKNRLIKQVLTRTINNGNGDMPLGTETYTRQYNEYNQITRLENSYGEYKTWTYNENGQLLICETNSPPGVLEFRYDANGNEIYKNDSRDIYVSEYNELNQKIKTSVYFAEKGVTDEPYSTYEYTYDEEGRLVNEAYNSVSIGNKTYYYNELGLLEKTVQAATNGARAVITTVYNYDDNGNLISEGQLGNDGSVYITCEYAVVYR